MLTRRILLPMLAAIPVRRRSAPERVPRVPDTRLILGGDVMLSRFVGKFARQRGDPASPLRELAPVLASADIAFVNLEAPFSDRGKLVESGMIFKAEPEMIGALELAGIDIVSTANNHTRDCGGYGVEFTLDWLAGHGIAAVGTAKSAEAAHAGAVLTRNGTRFGFLAYTFDQSNGNHRDVDDRIAALDVDQMREDVGRMLGREEALPTVASHKEEPNVPAQEVADLAPKARADVAPDAAGDVNRAQRHEWPARLIACPTARADVVIVSMHAGVEYSPRPNRQQIEFAHAAINAGARVVVGHHPHVVEPWEKIIGASGDGVIFYSLGNLVFDQFQREETQHGALAELTFSGARLVHAEMVAVDIARTGPRLSGNGAGSPAHVTPGAAGAAGDGANKAR
jgi:poly-gamma-glutamate synthesis protein (capsule biosynthesis protein)